jgi:DNA-binding NarL/FixJ family response regulator
VVPLSEREREVLRQLADGRSNREIAAKLFLAEGTVKNHVTNVLAKLGARDRTQAALRARALGLL